MRFVKRDDAISVVVARIDNIASAIVTDQCRPKIAAVFDVAGFVDFWSASGGGSVMNGCEKPNPTLA